MHWRCSPWSSKAQAGHCRSLITTDLSIALPGTKQASLTYTLSLAQERKCFVWCYTAVREGSNDNMSCVHEVPTTPAPRMVAGAPSLCCNTPKSALQLLVFWHKKLKCGCAFSHGKLSCICQTSAEPTVLWKTAKCGKNKNSCSSYISLMNSINHSIA